ncbi:hypothetical protein V6Z11_A05G326600 [Gossypium hirsutum]
MGGSRSYSANPSDYKLLEEGLIEGISSVLNKRKEDEKSPTELTRTDIIKCIQSKRVKFRGVNLSSLDLSKLEARLGLIDLLFVAFVIFYLWISALLVSKTYFLTYKSSVCKISGCGCYGFEFSQCNFARGRCEFTGANLRGALLAGANLQSANLQDASLIDCSFCGADLCSAHLQGAQLSNVNLKGANLQRAYL